MTRFAIFFAPAPDTPLWKFGSAALGYDSAAVAEIPFHESEFHNRTEICEWTADPRRYGFHATLKPPFALSDGRDIDQLEAAATEFAAAQRRFSLDRLEVAAIGNFLALVPSTPSQHINRLAADCVRAFEPFRAPLTVDDRKRRLQSPLTEKQSVNLDQWGYPYVFDEFRFHMTLTGRLPEDVKASGQQALAKLYGPICEPVLFDAVTICQQADRTSRFRIRRRFNFAA